MWIAGLLVVAGTVPAIAAVGPGRRCEEGAAAALRTCLRSVVATSRACYRRTGVACAPADRKTVAALARLGNRVRARCRDAATVQAAGFGPLFTVDALVARTQEACRGEAASLAARSFGGPHGAALDAGEACLLLAHREAARALDRAQKLRSACVTHARRGRVCNAAATDGKVAAAGSRAAARIERACPDGLETLVGLDAATFVARADAQARCLAATAHPDPAPLALDCGPRDAVPVPARGTAVQVVLDEAVWGTRCGDGSPFAFWLRLAPAGAPAENVVVFLQGGGVCVLGTDCASRPADLFEALGDPLPQGGWMSNDPATNPFGDWTKVYLPYCNQDLFIGGGTTSAFASRTVYRHGSLNVRAALRWVRDVLWAELDATTPEGYRADRPRVAFGGTSAGGFGVMYNYHWVLDDLRWPRATAVPDSSLALDSGGAFSVRALGSILVDGVPPLDWGSRPFLPPYCFGPDCAVGPELEIASALRLGIVPEQRILNVSNQVDAVQRSTTFFPDMRAWTDAARTAYCGTQGLPGIDWFLSADPTSIHGVLTSGARWNGIASASVILRDWVASAIGMPASVTDAVEEGALVATLGVEPFACL
jgi:hypothetical protein